MKKIFIGVALIIAVFTYNNCVAPKYISRYYEGYICTTKGEPTMGLIIYHYGITTDSVGITDENGYFRLKKSKGFVVFFLIVEFEGKIIDSIQVPRGHGRSHSLCFVEGTKDTLFIDIKGEKKSFEHHDHHLINQRKRFPLK